LTAAFAGLNHEAYEREVASTPIEAAYKAAAGHAAIGDQADKLSKRLDKLKSTSANLSKAMYRDKDSFGAQAIAANAKGIPITTKNADMAVASANTAAQVVSTINNSIVSNSQQTTTTLAAQQSQSGDVNIVLELGERTFTETLKRTLGGVTRATIGE